MIPYTLHCNAKHSSTCVFLTGIVLHPCVSLKSQTTQNRGHVAQSSEATVLVIIYLSAEHYSTYQTYQTCEYDLTGEFTELSLGILRTQENSCCSLTFRCKTDPIDQRRSQWCSTLFSFDSWGSKRIDGKTITSRCVMDTRKISLISKWNSIIFKQHLFVCANLPITPFSAIACLKNVQILYQLWQVCTWKARSQYLTGYFHAVQ